MKKVLTVGVFDYFHYGHLRLFKQARNCTPDPYLIVAVQEDDFIKKYKPDSKIFYTQSIRKEIISELKCVDEVVFYQDISSFIKSIDFDIFAVGEDQNHAGFQEAIKYCEENHKQVARLKRTKGVSSSEIKQVKNNENC